MLPKCWWISLACVDNTLSLPLPVQLLPARLAQTCPRRRRRLKHPRPEPRAKALSRLRRGRQPLATRSSAARLLSKGAAAHSSRLQLNSSHSSSGHPAALPSSSNSSSTVRRARLRSRSTLPTPLPRPQLPPGPARQPRARGCRRGPQRTRGPPPRRRQCSARRPRPPCRSRLRPGGQPQRLLDQPGTRAPRSLSSSSSRGPMRRRPAPLRTPRRAPAPPPTARLPPPGCPLRGTRPGVLPGEWRQCRPAPRLSRSSRARKPQVETIRNRRSLYLTRGRLVAERVLCQCVEADGGFPLDYWREDMKHCSFVVARWAEPCGTASGSSMLLLLCCAPLCVSRMKKASPCRPLLLLRRTRSLSGIRDVDRST